MEEYIQPILDWAKAEGFKIVLAPIFCLIAFRVINHFEKRVLRSAEKQIDDGKPLNKTAIRALTHICNIALKIVVVLCLITYLGMDTSGFTALIASFGVCIGLATNGALSNLAGGILLMLTHPFKVDDFIKADDYEGTVEDIFICHTKLRTADNKVIYLPNGTLSSETIVNYSEKETRRVELVFSIAYEDDFEKAKAVIADLCEQHEKILKDPSFSVRMSAHSANSVDLTCRAWVKRSDVYTVKCDLLESVKCAFDKNGISIPYQQVDVHIKENK